MYHKRQDTSVMKPTVVCHTKYRNQQGQTEQETDGAYG